MSNQLVTSVTKVLDKFDVAYRVLWQSIPTRTIEDTAQARGIAPHTMVKSILLRDMGNQYVLACVPGDRQVDPKKVREVLGLRRTTCVSFDAVETICGYTPGLVNPIDLPSSIAIIFHQELVQLPLITISSGHPLAGLALTPPDLFSVISATTANICK